MLPRVDDAPINTFGFQLFAFCLQRPNNRGKIDKIRPSTGYQVYCFFQFDFPVS